MPLNGPSVLRLPVRNLPPPLTWTLYLLWTQYASPCVHTSRCISSENTVGWSFVASTIDPRILRVAHRHLHETVYHCKTHTYLILLNRQRVEKNSAFTHVPISRDPTFSFRAINTNLASQHSPSASTSVSLRGRSLVLSSSEEVISAFMFFYFKEPAALIDWTLGQQAFNSCMLLLYDAIETRSITIGARKVEQVFVVFQELQDNGVHELASQAVDRISWGLTELHKLVASSAAGNEIASSQHQLTNTTLEAKQNEATYQSGSIDAVMGSTGMMLLEDPGLQAFVHEAYAPITWISSEPADHFLHERGHQSPDSVGHMKEESTSDDFDVVRSPGAMQSKRRWTVAQSETGPHMNLSLGKPQSYTTPASATEVATAHQHAYKGDSTNFHQKHQHQHQHQHKHQQSCEQHPSNPHQHLHAPAVHVGRSSGVDHQHQSQHLQLRHNSCPTIANQVTHPPPIRPTYSSPSIVNRPVVTQSSYRAANHVLTPTLHTSDTANFTLAHFEHAAPSDYMGYHHHPSSFTTHGPGVTLLSTTTLTPLTEDLGMEDWRHHFVSSAGTG